MASVTAKGIVRRFPREDGGERTALAGVDLHVADGEFVALLGPSGCGKTTLLKILSGLDAPDAGRVELGTRDDHRPVVSHVFQEARLLPWLRVGDNLAFVQNGPRREGAARREAWLERVGLAGLAREYPGRLSIGMQQRVAVARAFLVEPDVLFLDEPFSALDELTAMEMREQLLGLYRERRCTVVLVTHNPMEAVLLADRVLIMTPSPGRIGTELRVSDDFPRPRDPDDERLWRLSRAAVHQLGS